MKKNIDAQNSDNLQVPSSRATVPRATLLYRELRAALDIVAQRQFAYEDLALLIGEPRSTLGNWNNGDGQPGCESLLRLLELLPVTERNAILSKLPFCRQYPTVDHPRIAHDPVAVSYLHTTLRFEKGITFVCGERDSMNTFVATALAHSFLLLPGNRGQTMGLDVHAPDWFVPVPGVTYLNNAIAPIRIRNETEKMWRTFASSKYRLVLLNGTWATAPELQSKTCELAETCHVIVTEILRSKNAAPSTLPAPARLIVVTPEGRESDRIRTEVQFL